MHHFEQNSWFRNSNSKRGKKNFKTMLVLTAVPIVSAYLIKVMIVFDKTMSGRLLSETNIKLKAVKEE